MPRPALRAMSALCVIAFAAGIAWCAEPGRLERAWSRIKRRAGDLSSPELLGFALDAAAAGAPAERIEKALELAEDMQDRDPESRAFGNFRWHRRSTKITDFSAVEFAMQRAALIALARRERLSPDANGRLDRLIRFGVQGIRRHRVPPAHTNVFLMKAWNCLALGQVRGDEDLRGEGARMLDAWLMGAWESGVREFNSPAYYGVDVASLGLIARWISDAAVVENAEAALGLFWADIAAHWFAPSFRLGGARSRDFDLLTGHGQLDDVLAALKWIPSDEPHKHDALLAMSLWEPPTALTRPILNNRPRTVVRRWGAGQGEWAVTYVGKGVCLGTSGAGFGPVDRVLTADLGGGPMTPRVSFHMDGRGDPYGVRPAAGGGGHRKAMHLTPFVASVQRGREALLLASADTADAAHFRYVPDPTCLLSHLVLPQADEVWVAKRKIEFDPRGDAGAVDRSTFASGVGEGVGGKDAEAGDVRASSMQADAASGDRSQHDAEKTSGSRSWAVFAGEPVFVRLGKAALAVRVVLAQDTAGNPAAAALQADGGKHGAMRLTVTHSPDAPKGRGTVALWVRVEDGIDDDGDFADFRKGFRSLGSGVFSDGRADVSVPGLKSKLRLFADVWKHRPIAVEGGERIAPDCVLAIDGREHGRRLLEGSEIVGRYRAVLGGKVKGAPTAGAVMEAEMAPLLLAPLVAAADSRASEGRCAWSPASPGGAGSPRGRAVWAFNVPASGAYIFEARVMSQPGRRDGLAVRIRQHGRDVLPPTDLPGGAGRRWRWLRLADEGRNTPTPVKLRAGPAAVEVLADGAMIDAIRLAPVRQR